MIGWLILALLPIGVPVRALAQEVPVRTLTIQTAGPSRVQVADTYITAADPDRSHDAEPILSLSGRSVALLRFDLSELPADAEVASASLVLWVDGRSAPLPLDVAAYPLARPWEAGATWREAAPGRPWGRPGAVGEADRGDAVAHQRLDGVGRWYTWDVTAAVRQQAGRPDRDLHLALAADFGGTVEYYLASSEWNDVGHRPRLTIRYREPVELQVASVRTDLVYGKEYFPAMPYVMYDWRNRNWQAEAPQRGPIGSHIEFTWEDINPAPGQFDWSKFDEYLRVARTQRVTLPDGSSIYKPVMFTLMLAASGEEGRFRDFTPTWVYDAMDGRPELDGRPVGYVVQPEGCAPAAVPLYDDLAWQSALASAIAAFGARYDQNPLVAGIWIGAGLDDETQPAKRVGSCDYPTELARYLDCEAYMRFLDRLMGWYADAFPHKPLWIQAAPSACVGRSGPWSRRRIMLRAAKLGIGYKANALQPDMVTAVGYLNSTGWQKMDTADRFAGQVPIAFEPAFSNPVGGEDPVEYAYWMVHNALAHHATFIDLQDDWLGDLDQVPEVWRTMQESLNRTAADAPAVWIVLRDAECAPVMWKNSGNGCDPGDWSFYLYRSDDLPGNRTVHLREEDLPRTAADQPFGRHARRTDEASGNPWISLDVDDAWQFAGQLPVAYGGQVQYEVSVWYLDQGTDVWLLEYADPEGTLRQVRVEKTDSGRWREAVWVLDDLFLADMLPGGMDLRLNSAGDGDDIFHKITIRGIRVPKEPVAATPTPGAGSTPSPSPTLAVGGTVTPTPTPTPERVSTPTPTPTSAVQVIVVPPSPTPTPTVEVIGVLPSSTPTPTPQKEIIVFSEPLALTPTPTAAAPMYGRAGDVSPPSRVMAKVEALWPSAPGHINATVYLFADRSLDPPPCDWEPTVLLWGAVGDDPARMLAVGRKRMAQERGRTFPAWDFTGVNIDSLQRSGEPMHFFASVEGVDTVWNVVSMGQDARTLGVAEPVPAGLLTSPPAEVDAKIFILWPHGGAPVSEAKRANLTAILLETGTQRAFPAKVPWLPTVRLHWSINHGVDLTGGKGMIGVPREVSRGGMRYVVWDFNNVDVRAARNPNNRMYFWLSVDGIRTNTSVWVHSADGRPILQTADLPARSCR